MQNHVLNIRKCCQITNKHFKSIFLKQNSRFVNKIKCFKVIFAFANENANTKFEHPYLTIKKFKLSVINLQEQKHVLEKFTLEKEQSSAEQSKVQIEHEIPKLELLETNLVKKGRRKRG